MGIESAEDFKRIFKYLSPLYFLLSSSLMFLSLTTITAIVKDYSMRSTPSTILIANLAVVDMFLACFALLISLLKLLGVESRLWMLWELKISGYIVISMLSLLSTFANSVDRYIYIRFSIKYPRIVSVSRTKKAVAFIWAFSVVFALFPIAFDAVWERKTFKLFEISKARQYGNYIPQFVLYILTSLTIHVMYLILFRVVRKKTRSLPGSNRAQLLKESAPSISVTESSGSRSSSLSSNSFQNSLSKKNNFSNSAGNEEEERVGESTTQNWEDVLNYGMSSEAEMKSAERLAIQKQLKTINNSSPTSKTVTYSKPNDDVINNCDRSESEIGLSRICDKPDVIETEYSGILFKEPTEQVNSLEIINETPPRETTNLDEIVNGEPTKPAELEKCFDQERTKQPNLHELEKQTPTKPKSLREVIDEEQTKRANFPKTFEEKYLPNPTSLHEISNRKSTKQTHLQALQHYIDSLPNVVPSKENGSHGADVETTHQQTTTTHQQPTHQQTTTHQPEIETSRSENRINRCRINYSTARNVSSSFSRIDFRTARTLFILLEVYIVLWGPSFLIQMVGMFHDVPVGYIFFAYFLAMSNSLINFFVYPMKVKRIRTAFISALKKSCSRSR